MIKIIDTYKATMEIENNLKENISEKILIAITEIVDGAEKWVKSNGYIDYPRQSSIEKVSFSPFVLNYTLEIIENIPDEYIWKPPEEAKRIEPWTWCDNKCKDCNENDWCKMRDKND